MFQPDRAPEAGKVRIHLDVTVNDIGEATRIVIALGGPDIVERHDYGEGVVTLITDLGDHEFCLVQSY